MYIQYSAAADLAFKLREMETLRSGGSRQFPKEEKSQAALLQLIACTSRVCDSWLPLIFTAGYLIKR